MKTRIWQAGFETRDTDEFPERDLNQQVVSSASAKTGSFALRLVAESSDRYGVVPGLSASHVQVGMQYLKAGTISDSGVGVTPCPYLVRFFSEDGAWIGGVRLSPTNVFFLDINGSQVATGSTYLGTETGVDGYRHVGIDFMVNASGWLALYLDGRLEAYYSGDTTIAGSKVSRVYIPYLLSNSIGAYHYLDDIYIDQVDGASTMECPDDLRFLPIVASTPGASANWDVVGASVNVEAVDDWGFGKADDDSTYVSSSVASTIDFYFGNWIMEGTIPASNIINALIVQARALKTNAAASTQLKLAVRRASPSAVSYSDGKDLESSYGIVWHRFTEDPYTGSPWEDYEDLNETEFGIKPEP